MQLLILKYLRSKWSKGALTSCSTVVTLMSHMHIYDVLLLQCFSVMTHNLTRIMVSVGVHYLVLDGVISLHYTVY